MYIWAQKIYKSLPRSFRRSSALFYYIRTYVCFLGIGRLVSWPEKRTYPTRKLSNLPRPFRETFRASSAMRVKHSLFQLTETFIVLPGVFSKRGKHTQSHTYVRTYVCASLHTSPARAHAHACTSCLSICFAVFLKMACEGSGRAPVSEPCVLPCF